MTYFDEEYPAGEKGLRARLQNVVDSDFAHITYTQAVELLNEHINNGTVLHKIVQKTEKVSKGELKYFKSFTLVHYVVSRCFITSISLC